MRYLMTISYDGSMFYGFQKLKDKITIQGEIENALFKIIKKKIQIKGAGRTDRGVHAISAKCHFDLETKISLQNLKYALNRILNKHIYIKKLEEVDTNFSSRFDVKEKIYIYKIWTGEYNPLLENYYLQSKDKYDFKKLKKCLKLFCGEHNFASFVSGSHLKTNSKIFKTSILKKKCFIEIAFKGTKFFQYMVRNMVGATLMVGKNKISLEKVKSLLDNPNIDAPKWTAKANALYLYDVKY